MPVVLKWNSPNCPILQFENFYLSRLCMYFQSLEYDSLRKVIQECNTAHKVKKCSLWHFGLFRFFAWKDTLKYVLSDSLNDFCKIFLKSGFSGKNSLTN